MLFSVMMLIGFVWMGFQFRYLLRLRKDDRVLYRFCELRSETVQFIANHVEDLTPDDYLYARYMLEVMNSSVTAFKINRHHFFNLRAFLAFLRTYDMSAVDIQKVPRSERPELMEIERQLGAAMSKGFLAYTPFIRSEIGARVLILVAAFVARLGLRTVANRGRELGELLASSRKHALELRSIAFNGPMTISQQHLVHC